MGTFVVEAGNLVDGDHEVEDQTGAIEVVEVGVTKERRPRKARAEREPYSGPVQVCAHCGLEKPLPGFRLSAGHPRLWCGDCVSAYNKDRRNRLVAGEVPADKWCTNCGQVKDMEAFAPSASKPDGRNTWCRQCVTDYRLEHNPPKPKAEKAERPKRGPRPRKAKVGIRMEVDQEFAEQVDAQFREMAGGE